MRARTRCTHAAAACVCVRAYDVIARVRPLRAHTADVPAHALSSNQRGPVQPAEDHDPEIAINPVRFACASRAHAHVAGARSRDRHQPGTPQMRTCMRERERVRVSDGACSHRCLSQRSSRRRRMPSTPRRRRPSGASKRRMSTRSGYASSWVAAAAGSRSARLPNLASASLEGAAVRRWTARRWMRRGQQASSR